MSFIQFISQPWPWYVSGAMIALLMAFLLFSGKTFGFSSNFRTLCAACGAGKMTDYFDIDWKAQSWNLFFLAGSVLGGSISAVFLSSTSAPELSPAFIETLHQLGFKSPQSFQPEEIYGTSQLLQGKGILILITGGFLIGFGSRYAGGCTSGHAITGLSSLQWQSLLAVSGFFIGGLLMTWYILPYLFSH